MSDAAAPTGCFKCGRPGHWSRDCPLSSTNPNPNPSPNSSGFPSSTSFSKDGGGFPPKEKPKPKKAPRTRPKLTPDLLLSDDGLGYILRYFPRNFKYRGRGHEVSDLRNLLHMYAEWHAQFLPYFPFDQFIHKVEEAGSSKRLRNCIAELKERVAKGGDPTKLKEVVTENEKGYDKEEEPTHHQEDMLFNENIGEEMQEDIFNEIYNNTVEETSSKVQRNNPDANNMPSSDNSMNTSDKALDTEGGSGGNGGGSSGVRTNEDLKALVEAKRLKALERAAARSRLMPMPPSSS